MISSALTGPIWWPPIAMYHWCEFVIRFLLQGLQWEYHSASGVRIFGLLQTQTPRLPPHLNRSDPDLAQRHGDTEKIEKIVSLCLRASVAKDRRPSPASAVLCLKIVKRISRCRSRLPIK